MTKGLTEGVRGYSSRTVYRYAGKLTGLDVIAREEQAGVPSGASTRSPIPAAASSRPRQAFATTAMTRLPDGSIDSQTWASSGSWAQLCRPLESRLPATLHRRSHLPGEEPWFTPKPLP